jgi:uncharacterized protein YaaN involved in tellurite resistance
MSVADRTGGPRDGFAVPVASPERVEQIRRSIDLADTMAVVTFGREAGERVLHTVEQMMGRARNRSFGKAGELLADVVLQARGLDPKALEGGGLTALFTSAEARLKSFIARYEAVADQFDTILIEVEKQVATVERDIAFFDALYRDTLTQIAEFDAYLAAGHAFVDHFAMTELPAMRDAVAAAQAGSADQTLRAQRVREAETALANLKDRLFRIEQAKMLAIQRLDQARLVQDGDVVLVRMLADTKALTIPAWKTEMAVALGIENQRRALALQRSITDATNDILARSAEQAGRQRVEIEREAKRGLVDVEVVRARNKALIEAVTGVDAVRREQDGARAGVVAEFRKLADELARTVVDGAATPRP